MTISSKSGAGQDLHHLPGVVSQIDVNAPKLLYLVMDELHRRGQPGIIEYAEKLPYVYWSDSAGKWIPAGCPEEVYRFMKGIR